ncbi:hypothetical protein F7430_22370 [Salmonella enterica]|nr:hypothetical protein [Salmonella enterica]ECZ0806892.1 hypothetical protein [Salmonella enterica]EHF0215280.1 hypothetical protein [Salmonella enterica]EHS7647127.1 hypothetical protein [Salmonella enterica]EJH8717653.1 hypothetical protein [Escherichia coli]
MDLWYRRTFRLTANDPLFLNTTLEERLTDYWAWQYADDPKLMETVEDESFDLEAIQQEWADAAGEDADIYVPPVTEPVADPDQIDDWEDV